MNLVLFSQTSTLPINSKKREEKQNEQEIF